MDRNGYNFTVNRKGIQHVEPPQATCGVCGATFTKRSRNQIYCCRKCCEIARDARKAGNAR